MNSGENKRKRYKPAERVSLTLTNVELLDKLLSQVQLALPELKLSRSDLVNWLLRNRGSMLTDREIAAVQRDYFDPVKALEAAIAQAKKQQGLGEEVDVQALVNERLLLKKRRATKRKPARNLDRTVQADAVNAALD